MRRKRAIVLVLVAVLALLVIAYLWIPGSVPAGQKPLLALSSANFSEFEKAFDDNPDVPRLLLLVSPT
jgi:hypothetical protein